ncbi:hypothetical protein BH11MYX1_BH11MYX1_00130 [soil metagenome]
MTDNLARYSIDVMTVVEPDGTISWISPSCVELIGRPTETAIGTNIAVLTHPDDATELAEAVASVLRGEEARLTHRVHHGDGTWRMFETVAKNLVGDPAVAGVLLQSRDVTSAAQMEAMLAESRDAAYDLAGMRADLIQRLQELDQSKAQLSAALVHDLKTPLTVIMLSSQYVAEDLDKPEALLEHASLIGRAADSMHRMVLDLLDVGRSEDGHLRANMCALDLTNLFADLAERAAPLLKDRNQALHCEVVGKGAQGAADLLGRTIQNLLDNCSKYAPNGSPIVLRGEVSETRVEISVADRGPGIPEEFKQKIFELYTRIDRDPNTRNSRTSRGVGLAFCKLALAAHAGEICVEDHPGGGSIFRCYWPR